MYLEGKTALGYSGPSSGPCPPPTQPWTVCQNIRQHLFIFATVLLLVIGAMSTISNAIFIALFAGMLIMLSTRFFSHLDLFLDSLLEPPPAAAPFNLDRGNGGRIRCRGRGYQRGGRLLCTHH